MSPERKRQVDKFNSKRSGQKWGAACGVSFIFLVGAAVVDGLVGLFL